MITLEESIKAARLFPCKRNTMPVLAMVAINGKVESTDLESWYSVPVQSSNLLGCYDLADLAVSFDVKPAANLDEFPASPILPVLKDATTVKLARLLEEIDRCIPYASTDCTRYINGLFFEHGKRIVATDGHRLIVSEMEHGLNAILPSDGLKKLAKVLRLRKKNFMAVDIYSVVDWVFFRIIGTDETIMIRKIDGQFPDYRQVIPAGKGSTVTISGDVKSSVASLQPIIKRDKSKRVAVRFTKDQTGITFTDETIKDLYVVGSTPSPVTIGIQAKYLAEGITSTGQTTVTTFQPDSPKDNKPIVMESLNGLVKAVIMPIRFE